MLDDANVRVALWLVPLNTDKWWRLDRHTRLPVACLTPATTPHAYMDHLGVGLDEPAAVVRSDHHCLPLRTFRHDGRSTTGALEDEERLDSHALRLPDPRALSPAPERQLCARWQPRAAWHGGRSACSYVISASTPATEHARRERRDGNGRDENRRDRAG